MSSHVVSSVRVRAILDSSAQPTLEADVVLHDGAAGRGSCPVAIAPGRREPRFARVGPLDARPARAANAAAARALTGKKFDGQRSFDAVLEALTATGALGANGALALSLAFCRAAARAAGVPLHRHVAALAGTSMRMPHPLVNIFSGGIHIDHVAASFQQVMFIPQRPTVTGDIVAALAVFEAAERRTADTRLSQSSGLVRRDTATPEALLRDVLHAARDAGLHDDAVSVGIDVAGEHLATGGRYRLGERSVTGRELHARIERMAGEFPLVYIEDPFDAEDAELWCELTASVGARALVVGDDLFATTAARVRPRIANTILLKPSQAGTMTAMLAAALRACEQGLELCVSHRSGETEDIAICDIAVALGARYVKVGGPRRGDRLAKYNQLLRLAEDPAVAPAGVSEPRVLAEAT